MGLFSGVGQAKVTQGGIYFEPGNYLVEIQRVCAIRSQKDRKDYFIVEAKILESDCPTRKPGTVASQAIDISNVMGPVNIKAFLAAAMGIDPADQDAVEEALGVELDARGKVAKDKGEEAAEYATSEENPLEGLKLRLNCAEIRTQKGNPFTKHNWRPLEEAAA